MALFTWNGTFETGHHTIDQQHCELVSIINQLDDALIQSPEEGLPAFTLESLIDYAHYHFSTEEALMEADDTFPPAQADAHRKEHAEFIANLNRFEDSTQNSKAARDLLSFLVMWLRSHILGSDRQLTQQLGIDCPKPSASQQPAEQQLTDALHANQDRLKLLGDTASALLWSCDSSGDRHVFTPAWSLLTGQPPEQLQGYHWLQLLHPSDHDNYLSLYRRHLKSAAGYTTEYRLKNAVGDFLWLREQAAPCHNAAGEFTGLAGSCMEVTALKQAQESQRTLNQKLKQRLDSQSQELKASNQRLEALLLQGNPQEEQENRALMEQLQEAQQQLVQTEKMAAIGQLAAGVAHEINNPIGYVSSNLSTLENYVADLLKLLDGYRALEDAVIGHPQLAALSELKQRIDPGFLIADLKDLIEESKEGLGRVKQIVQDLKDFSRTDNGEWQPADIHRCLDSTLNVARNEIKYKAEVVKEYGALPELYCLPHQLCQVFMNLLINAAQAIEKQGQITIITHAEPPWAVIEIADNGAGIPEENLSQIFNAFFTTKPEGKGTGLGLSLSYEIVQRHRGEIRVNSQLGEGTRFTIKLPLEQPDDA